MDNYMHLERGDMIDDLNVEVDSNNSLLAHKIEKRGLRDPNSNAKSLQTSQRTLQSKAEFREICMTIPILFLRIVGNISDHIDHIILMIVRSTPFRPLL